jgi:pyruvate dehydrogenase E1 component alpha subunit
MVNGGDVTAVLSTAKELIDGARQGRPAFMAASCYRFFGHARMDKSPYRSAEEETEGRRIDAVLKARQALLTEGDTSEAELDALDRTIANEMDLAVDFAQASTEPTLDSMFRDVYGPGEPEPEPVAARLARIYARH